MTALQAYLGILVPVLRLHAVCSYVNMTVDLAERGVPLWRCHAIWRPCAQASAPRRIPDMYSRYAAANGSKSRREHNEGSCVGKVHGVKGVSKLHLLRLSAYEVLEQPS